jgi:perosamine synthetase
MSDGNIRSGLQRPRRINDAAAAAWPEQHELPKITGVSAGPPPDQLIKLYRPDLSGNERRYVLECLDSTWISSNGAFIPRFEKAFAEAIGASHAIAVSNGTVALHLALHALGIGPGDEVIVPTFTYISSVNTIAQTGATPVFVESRPDDWLLDPQDVERRVNSRTKAVMAVHLYGAVCDVSALYELTQRHGLALVEDAAEALGSTFDGRHVGTFGEIATFSFYGNKTVTTGEGGMVVTNDARMADRLRLLKGQGQSPIRRYWHLERGFNYRMTNICAAIGLAQLERFSAIVGRKRAIAARYRRLLKETPLSFQKPLPQVESGEWLVSVLLPNGSDRDEVIQAMEERGVETRPVFYCAHHMPMYAADLRLPVAEEISRRGISLPSHPQLTEADIERVASVLREAIAAGADGSIDG